MVSFLFVGQVLTGLVVEMSIKRNAINARGSKRKSLICHRFQKTKQWKKSINKDNARLFVWKLMIKETLELALIKSDTCEFPFVGN